MGANAPAIPDSDPVTVRQANRLGAHSVSASVYALNCFRACHTRVIKGSVQ